MSRGLRLLVGALIVGFPGALGWYFRSPMVIPILGAIYVPLYFLGKQGMRQVMRQSNGWTLILKSVPLTFLIQCVLAGVFYLVGLGLGTIFTDRSLTPFAARDAIWIAGFTLITSVISAYITYAETPKAAPAPETNEDDDFDTIDRIITPQTFYRGWHFSRPNYAKKALVDVVDHNGEKPVRAPKRASEAMISQAEDRLGIRLPDTLREIYKLQDGGALPTYYVPKFKDAAKTHDNWISAFADDYNDLKPLDQLATLYDSYMEYFDPKYSDPSEKDDWLPGSEKLVILTARTGYGTALDYRRGPTPGVLLFDNNVPTPELKQFDDFDTFFAALREIQFDYQRRPRPTSVAFGKPPNPHDPDRFWEKGNAGPGVNAEAWENASNALGVTLPDALRPFYEAANGGVSAYQVALAENENDAPLHVFPTGPYISAGELSKLEHFVTLAAFSDRLNFIDGRTPWRELYDNPEKLIVISAAFDSAILLDYRRDNAVLVRAIPDLDNPDVDIVFPSVTAFLTRLRKFGIPEWEEKNEIGDDQISARGSDTANFWIKDDAREPVADAVLKGFIDKWDYCLFGIPGVVRDLYQTQNGGAVRFRFAPPQKMNDYGNAITDPSAKTWVDVFPDGLLPMEDWRQFDDWRREHGLATEQSLFDFTGRVNPPMSEEFRDDVKADLFVIGEHVSSEQRIVTLLDMSHDMFNRNRHILGVQYDKATDRFEIMFGPILSDHSSAGLHHVLKARKTDL